MEAKKKTKSTKLTRDQFWELGMKFAKECDMDKLNTLFLCISDRDLPWCTKRLVYSDPNKKIGYGLISYVFASGDYDMLDSIRSLYSKKIKIHVNFLANAAKFNKYGSFKWLKDTNKNIYDGKIGGLQKSYVYHEKQFNLSDENDIYYNACLNDVILINMIEKIYTCKISNSVVIRCASRGELDLFEWAFEKYKKVNDDKVPLSALLGACESGNDKIVNRILHNKKYFEIDYNEALKVSEKKAIKKLLRKNM